MQLEKSSASVQPSLLNPSLSQTHRWTQGCHVWKRGHQTHTLGHPLNWERWGGGRGGGEKGDHRHKSRTTSLLRKTWRHAAVIILVPRPCQAFCHLQYRKAVFACGESMGMRLLQSLLQNLHHMLACPVLKGL